MQTTSLVFKFQGIYDLGDLAKYVGEELGIHLIAENPGDKIHGHLTASTSVTDENPQGYTLLQIHFNNQEETPNWDEATKEGHQSHLVPFHPTDDDYGKLQDAFIKLFNNETDSVKQLTQDQIAKLLK